MVSMTTVRSTYIFLEATIKQGRKSATYQCEYEETVPQMRMFVGQQILQRYMHFPDMSTYGPTTDTRMK